MQRQHTLGDQANRWCKWHTQLECYGSFRLACSANETTQSYSDDLLRCGSLRSVYSTVQWSVICFYCCTIVQYSTVYNTVLYSSTICIVEYKSDHRQLLGLKFPLQTQQLQPQWCLKQHVGINLRITVLFYFVVQYKQLYSTVQYTVLYITI